MRPTVTPPPAAPPAGAQAAWATASPARWRVRLLGAVEAFDGVQQLQRFPSRAVALLLARVAAEPQRVHPREELVELLWPGVAPAVGRNRLRQALSSLKSLLEPAGAAQGPVLLADRLGVRAAPGALDSDAAAFQRCCLSGDVAQALALWQGPFMPGHYDDWAQAERERLAHLHERLSVRLLEQLPAAQRQRLPAAIPAADPASAPAGAPVPAALPDATGTRLPHYLTRLFGAERPAAALRSLVLAHRLVSLVGAGGSGKTRLAVAVAETLRVGHGGQEAADSGSGQSFELVAFVSLVGCTSAAGVAEALARALQRPEAAGVDELLPALAGQRVLLVLDNFEQLVGHAEGLVATWLSQLPGLHVLVTTRRPLGLDGEVLQAAQPLPAPPEGASLDDIALNPAVALFLDRARAVRSDFHLTTRHAPAIAGLVRVLHGLPLAIELAASRVRSFAPAQLLGLLQDGTGPGRLALLARHGVRSGTDPRHASMTAVIAWSWSLLDAESRLLLQALTLFPAPAALQAVAAASALPAGAVAARLDDLVAHSLVRVTEAPGSASAHEAGASSARFELLEPVREFAALQAQGPEAGTPRAVLQARVQAWLLDWARALPQPLHAPRVAAELPLVLAQLQRAEAEPQAAVELAVRLRDHWETTPLPGSTLQALELALPQLQPDSPLQADALELLALLRFGAGYVDLARAHADAAVLAAGPRPAARARALVRRAWVDVAAGRTVDRASPRHAQARAWLEEALALAHSAGDRDAQARALHQLGVLAGHVHASAQGADPAAAEALFAQAQSLWHELGDTRRALARLRNRAQCWARLGRADEAMAAYHHCEQAEQAQGNFVGQIDCLVSMSELLAQQRQWAAALEANRRCLALCWQHWFRHGLAYALWNPPRLLARLRQPEAAVQVMAFASVFWTRQFGPLASGDQRHLQLVRALVQRQIGPGRTALLWQQGLALDTAGAVRLVLQAH